MDPTHQTLAVKIVEADAQERVVDALIVTLEMTLVMTLYFSQRVSIRMMRSAVSFAHKGCILSNS